MQISISSDSVILESLPSAVSFNNNQDSTEVAETVYNLCVCPSGRLYRVLASTENSKGCMVAASSDPCSN